MLSIDIQKLWAAMSAHEYGPEPIVIEIEDGEINVFTVSCLNEGGQEGLYVAGRASTLNEAIAAFEENLDRQISEFE